MLNGAAHGLTAAVHIPIARPNLNDLPKRLRDQDEYARIGSAASAARRVSVTRADASSAVQKQKTVSQDRSPARPTGREKLHAEATELTTLCRSLAAARTPLPICNG